MIDKKVYFKKISQAFENIGKDMPDDKEICLYKTGVLDSYDIIQLILEIELLFNISIDLDAFTEAELSLVRIIELLDKGK